MKHPYALFLTLVFASGSCSLAQHIEFQPAATGSSKILSPGSATPVIDVSPGGDLTLRANTGATLTLQDPDGNHVLAITAANKLRIGTVATGFILPQAGGTSGQVLTYPGTGTELVWQTPAATNAGTAGQVSFFSGTTNTISSPNLKWDNTNSRLGIGLGAGNPTEALDVSGNGKFSGNVSGATLTASTSSALGAATASGLSTGTLAVSSTSTFNSSPTFNTGGNTFTLPATRGTNGAVLTSNGSGGSNWGTVYALPGGASGGVTYYNPTGSNLENNAGVFFWDATNQRLAIGHNAPTEKLDVGGNAKVSGTLNIGGASTLAGAVTLNAGGNTFTLPTTRGTTGQLMMSNATTTGWTSGLTWDNTNTRLGFNTAIPLANLHVKQKTSTENAAVIYETTANSAYTSAGVKNSGTASMTVSNATSSGTISWTSLTNITASDNVYATVTTGTAQQSHRIQPLGFFNPVANNVPAGASITGIMVYVERKASVGSSVKDFAVQLLKSGTTVGTAKSLDEFWTTSDVTVVYGSPSDTWGATWTVADINSATTGLDFSVTTAGAATASVDQIRMVVYYTLSNSSGSAVVWSSGVADGTNKFTVAQDNTIGADQDVFAITPKGDVEIYGSYTYAFPQSHTLTINNAAFTLYSTNVVYDITRAFSSYPVYAYMTGGTQASLGQMVASVSVPDGATITSVTARMAEDLTTVISRVDLVRCSDVSGTVLASCTTTDIGLQTVTQDLNHIVDNDNYSYALVFHGSQNAGTATGSKSLLYNVKITYLTSKAD